MEIDPPPSILVGERPRTPASLLSRSYRDRLLERGFLGLYRWYVARSQKTRNWNADLDFDWRNIRTDHSSDVSQILEGFFAVEQYVPDFTSKLLNVIRRSYGRSHFHIRWGSEEEKHADTWYNAVLFSKSRSLDQLEEYKYQLRQQEWNLPWDDSMHMIVYTVFQERATQLNYLNLAKAAIGQHDKLPGAIDPVLARVANTIATDEAAHYNFFLEGMRLYMYYYPLETLEAMRDVLEYFAMPAEKLIPNWQDFFEVAYRCGIYGPRQYARDVVAAVFEQLGVPGRKALENGIKRTRLVPDEAGKMRETAIWESFDPSRIEEDVKRIYERINKHESGYGMDAFDPATFTPNPAWRR
jgi:acyl-[acyl-carrier-protein] desaturase